MTAQFRQQIYASSVTKEKSLYTVSTVSFTQNDHSIINVILEEDGVLILCNEYTALARMGGLFTNDIHFSYLLTLLFELHSPDSNKSNLLPFEIRKLYKSSDCLIKREFISYHLAFTTFIQNILLYLCF